MILEGLANRKTEQQIAEEVGLSKIAVQVRKARMRERGIIVPDRSTVTDGKILEGLSEGKTIQEISIDLGLSPYTISKRIKTMQEQDEKKNSQLVMGIINLMKTRNATREQIQLIAEYYNVDFNLVLQAIDEQER